MMTYPSAIMALLLMSATTPIESATRKQKQEFTKAMNSFNPSGRKLDAKSFVAELGGSSQRSRSLRNKVMKKATFVPPEDIRKHGGNPLLDNKKQHRSLENEEQAQKNYWNQYKDGADDYFVAAGEWNNEFGFDPTQFAFSYARCAQVRQFDDELAATEDSLSVFATTHFAIFRFCPAMTCMGVNNEEDAEQQNQNGQQNNNRNSAYNTAYYGYTDNDVYGEVECEEGQEGCEEEVLVGANAEGCQSNYGEYMIELEDYLAIMQEYHEERFEAMCEYCDDCMEAVYQKWMQSQRRDLSNESEESLRESFRELGERELGIDYYGICPEWDVCSQDVCGGGMEDEYSDYFECTEVERNNGMVAYVGPHCAQDGMTVTLGVFADEYCNEYIGYGVNIRNYIGEDLDEDALQEYYNPIEEQCIPCRASDQRYEQDSKYYQDGTDDTDWEEEEVSEICSAMYESAARCDKHYRSFSQKYKNNNLMADQMNLACDFIDSIVQGSYDEMGFVILENSTSVLAESSLLKNNMYYEEYGHYVEEVSPLQVFGLCASLAVCGILALWSMTLHRSLNKKKPWMPRRGNSSQPATSSTLSHTNSGIMMGRSQSGASYYAS